MNVALATYLVKIVVLGVFMGIFKNTTLFNTKAFGLTVLACALVWVGFQVRAFLKLKMLYVEPEPPKARGTASTGEDR
jgi:ATP synthase protein I